MIVGDPAVSGGLDAIVKASYNLSVTIQDVEAEYTSPPKQFVVNVSVSTAGNVNSPITLHPPFASSTVTSLTRRYCLYPRVAVLQALTSLLARTLVLKVLLGRSLRIREEVRSLLILPQ